MKKEEFKKLIRSVIKESISKKLLKEEVSEFNYIVGEELKSEPEISQFVKVNGFDPVILDIWNYAKSNLHMIPVKIVKLRGDVGEVGMRYNLKSSKYIEISVYHQSKKRKPDIYLFDQEDLIKGGQFSYKLFSDLINF